MKRTGICPKCGSGDIVMVEPGLYNSFPVGLTGARLERWVCCACGFTEEWVEPDKLKKVKEYWSK